MRKLAVTAAFLFAAAAIVSLVAAPAPAQAEPRYLLTLTSLDAGSTQTLAVPAQSRACISCLIPGCYKLTLNDGGDQSANCAQDWPVGGANKALLGQAIPTHCFDTAGRNRIVAAAADAGDPGCRVYVDAVNARNPGFSTSR